MPNDMLPHILIYFRAEKSSCLYLLLIALAAILVSAWLWWSKSNARGMALPLTLIAIIQLIAGGTVYLRTDKQIDSLTEQYYSNRAAYKIAETARMDRVMAGFHIYKVVEGVLLVLGILMIAVYRTRPFVFTAGLGLVLQAAIMLGFDWMAATRAAVYVAAVSKMK